MPKENRLQIEFIISKHSSITNLTSSVLLFQLISLSLSKELAFTFFIFIIMNILLIIIFPNAYTISGFDSAICKSTNQQPEPECSYRYQCSICSKISNVTQAFRYCNYNRNRAEKLPTATQTPAAPVSAHPIWKFKCSFLPFTFGFQNCSLLLDSLLQIPHIMQVLFSNLSWTSPWLSVLVSIWTHHGSLSEAPGHTVLNP